MVSDFPNLDLQWTAIKPELSYKFRGVIISLSGGPDSTALLRVFCDFAKRKKNLKIRAIHVNFGLRGAESDGDESFCRSLCATLNVPVDVKNVKRLPIDTGSVQEWARNIRIEFLQKYLDEGWIVATGHHQGDLAENVIFRLIRGFSVAHLAGMKLWNGSHWRPFLGYSKERILGYLADIKQDFRHDVSNDGKTYTRNRIRHDILPVLQALAPNAVENICRASAETASIAGEFQNLTQTRRQQVLPEKLAAMDPLAAGFLIRQTILSLAKDQNLRLSRKVIDQMQRHVFGQTTGSSEARTFDIGKNLSVLLESGRISINKKSSDKKSKRLLQYAQQVNPTELSALIGNETHVFLRDSDAIWSASPSGKSRGNSLEFKLKNARSGNKIKLPGWKTGRSLKNIFQELNVSPDQRASYKVITKNGEQVGLFDGEKIINPANLAMQATIEGINFIITKKA